MNMNINVNINTNININNNAKYQIRYSRLLQQFAIIKNTVKKSHLVDLEQMKIQSSQIECQHVLYATPPDLQKCFRHRKANLIFKNITTSTMDQLQQPLCFDYCQCCGRIVGKQPQLKFNYDPIEAAYLGPGIPLLFAFFRSVLYLIMVYLICFGLYTTFTNINGTNCELGCGTPTFWNKISVFNIFDQYLTLKTQIYIELAIIILTIFVNISIRSYLNYLGIYIDQFFSKPSDYSIMIRNIPQDAKKQDIQQMIEKKRETLEDRQRQKTDNLKIVQILMVMDLKQFLEVEKKNLQLIKKQKNSKIKIHFQQEVFYENNVIPNKFAKTAIVIFSNDQSKNLFIDRSSRIQNFIRTLWGSYYPRSNKYQIKNQFVSIYRAPEPDDLIWHNCGKDSLQLLLRRIGLYLLSFIVLGIGGGLQYLIEFVRNKYFTFDNPDIQFVFSLGAALTVTTFNFLISQILEFMAFHQGHDTKTQLIVAMTFRIVLFQFLNSGIFVVFSNIFVKITTDQKTYDFRKTVLSNNIIQLMVMSAITGNLTTFFFNKFQVFSQYARRKIIKQKEIYPQIQANKIFQAPSMSIHFKYAFIFKTFWLTVFFMPTVPLVIAISAVGLLVNYWIQKYLFSGVYAAPQAISSYLSNHVLNLMDYTPLWLTLGSLFVHFLRKNFDFDKIESQVKTFHYLFLILSFINIFLPYHTILKRFNRYRQPTPNQTTYEQSVVTFELTYEDTNPVYLNHHKKRVRDQQVFRQKFVQQTQFKQMKLRLSQSQILMSQKQSLLNMSTVIGSSLRQSRTLKTRNRSSSLNF